ncbi:single hybrid motif-containing protein [Aspergillus pseudonomiae]|nr:single hybrid motif-containing protein [Aspergillus pseudonomiae]
MAYQPSRRLLHLYKPVLQSYHSRRYAASSSTSLYTQQPCRMTPYNLYRPFSIYPPRCNPTATVRIDSLGGESIDTCTLQSFHCKVGDYVERHGVLAVIETEKVGMDVEAPESGVIRHLFVKEGDVVTIGQAIAEIAIQAKKG